MRLKLDMMAEPVDVTETEFRMIYHFHTVAGLREAAKVSMTSPARCPFCIEVKHLHRSRFNQCLKCRLFEALGWCRCYQHRGLDLVINAGDDVYEVFRERQGKPASAPARPWPANIEILRKFRLDLKLAYKRGTGKKFKVLTK